MARRINEPIRVALRYGGREPAAFLWEGRRYAVERVEACWKEAGPWWDGEGEQTFFRVTAHCRLPGMSAGEPALTPQAAPGTRAAGGGPVPGGAAAAGVYELRFDHATAQWWLQEVVD